MMGLFDTHAHLYDKAFDRDREEVIHHIFETLDYVVIPSEDLVTSEKAVALAGDKGCDGGGARSHCCACPDA